MNVYFYIYKFILGPIASFPENGGASESEGSRRGSAVCKGWVKYWVNLILELK